MARDKVIARDLHESIVNSDDEDFVVLDVGVAEVAGDVVVGASGRESGGDTDEHGFA